MIDVQRLVAEAQAKFDSIEDAIRQLDKAIGNLDRRLTRLEQYR